MLTTLQQYQSGAPVFIIPKKEGTVMFITYYHRLMHDYEITQLLGILNGFEDLFDGTL